MAMLVPLIVVILVGVAVRYGSDSRDGRDWTPTCRVPRCTGGIVAR